MAFDIASGFNIGKLIDDAGRLPDGHFSFNQLDKITSGKYNVGLLKLGDGGKLVKFNNHVWRTGANNEKVTVAENIAVRNAVYRAIETRCGDFANSNFTKFLDTVRQELVGEARMHLPLSRNEVRAMLNQLKALSAGDSAKPASAFAPEKFLAAIQRHQPETMRKEFLWDLLLRYGDYKNCHPILSKIRTMLLRDDVWDSKDFDTWNIPDFPSSHFRNELFGQDFKDRAIALLEAVVKGVEDPQDRIRHLSNLGKKLTVATKDLEDAKQTLAKTEQSLSKAKAELLAAPEDKVAECQANVDKLTKEIKGLKKSIAYLTAFGKRCEAESPQKDELKRKAQGALAQGRLDVKKAETEFVESFSKQHPAIEWRLLFGELAEQYGSKEEFANIFPVFKDLVTRACAENRKLSPAIADKAREIFQIQADDKRMQVQEAEKSEADEQNVEQLPNWSKERQNSQLDEYYNALTEQQEVVNPEAEELSSLIRDLDFAYERLTAADEVEKQIIHAMLCQFRENQSTGKFADDRGQREIARKLLEFMSLYAASPKIPVQRETDESVVAGDKLLELRSRVAEAVKVASIETIGVMIDGGTKSINEQLEAGQTLTRQKVMECALNVNLAPMEVVGQLINIMVSIESGSVRDPKLSNQLQKDVRDIGLLLKTQRNLAKAESDQVWDQWQKGRYLLRVQSDYHMLLKKAAEVFSRQVSGLSFYGGKVREQFAAALLSLCDDNGLRVAFADAQDKGFVVVHKAMDKLDSQPRVQEPAVEDRDLADLNVGQRRVQDVLSEIAVKHEELWPKEGEEIPPGFSLAYVACQNFTDRSRQVGNKDLATIDVTVLTKPLVDVRKGFDSLVQDSARTLETLNGKSAGEFVSLVDQQFLAPIERRICELFGFGDFSECPEESITTAVDGIRETLEAIAAADSDTLEEKKQQLQGQCSVLLEALETAAGNMKKCLNSDLDVIATVIKESSWAPLEQSLERVKTKFSDLLSSNMQARFDMEAFERLVGRVKDGVFGFTEKRSELSEKFQSMLEDIKDVAQWFDSRELYDEFLGLRRQFDDFVADYDVAAQLQEPAADSNEDWS